MDLETENRLAALLMEEARRLRREADKEGVHVYLQKPNVRGRPNSRFLTATVRGVEQANRAAEISEMWRARDKELELDAKKSYKSKDTTAAMHSRNGYLNRDTTAAKDTTAAMHSRNCHAFKIQHEEKSSGSSSVNEGHKINSLYAGSHSRHENDIRYPAINSSSGKYYAEDSRSGGYTGLGDEEIEEFLHSRVKRGRGSVGCRMDEPGPYLPSISADHDGWIDSPATSFGENWKRRVLGPEKPHFVGSSQTHEGIGDAKNQAIHKSRSDKDHGKQKKKSKKEKSEKRSKEKRSKHHKKIR